MTPDISWIVAGVASIGLLFTILTFSRGSRFRDQDAVQAGQVRLDAAIKGLDEKLSERIEARSAQQDKSRHDMANSIGVQIAEQRRDLADLRAKAVTREDMAGFKSEMKADFVRLEGKIDRLLEGRSRISATG